MTLKDLVDKQEITIEELEEYFDTEPPLSKGLDFETFVYLFELIWDLYRRGKISVRGNIMITPGGVSFTTSSQLVKIFKRSWDIGGGYLR